MSNDESRIDLVALGHALNLNPVYLAGVLGKNDIVTDRNGTVSVVSINKLTQQYEPSEKLLTEHSPSLVASATPFESAQLPPPLEEKPYTFPNLDDTLTRFERNLAVHKVATKYLESRAQITCTNLDYRAATFRDTANKRFEVKLGIGTKAKGNGIYTNWTIPKDLDYFRWALFIALPWSEMYLFTIPELLSLFNRKDRELRVALNKTKHAVYAFRGERIMMLRRSLPNE